MSTKQNTTRGSHYLPQTYLKNFLLNNELVMYKKGEKFFSKKCSEVSRIVTVRGEKNISAIAKEIIYIGLICQELSLISWKIFSMT